MKIIKIKSISFFYIKIYFIFLSLLFFSCKETNQIKKNEFSLVDKDKIQIITTEKDNPVVSAALSKMLQEFNEEKLGQKFNMDKETIFIENLKFQIKAAANLYVYGDSLCMIEDLFIENKSSEIASELINQIKLYANTKGCETLFMYTNKEPKFYQDLGFELDVSLDDIILGEKLHVLLIKNFNLNSNENNHLKAKVLSLSKIEDRKKVDHFLTQAFEKKNETVFGSYNSQVTIIYAKDSNNEIIGGIKLYKYLNVSFLDYFVINKKFKSKGVGLEIIKQAENYARSKGCDKLFYDTRDFYQSKGFNQKNEMGYKLKFITSDHVFGYPRHIMLKTLKPKEKAKL